MKRKGLVIFLSLALSASLLFPQPKIRERDLPQKYQEWLKLVAYIIADKERDVFLKLTNDRDRDIFIESFWKARDPNPATPENEFKEEHIKRFLDANKKFRRYSPREGWITDMGRIYIILGPPISNERISGDLEVYPCEIWSYYGNPDRGDPVHFSLVFFQRGGAGEFKLYDPVSDGPAALLIQSKTMDPFDYEALFERIKEGQPSLALVSLSIIPGDIPYNYQPSPQNTILMAGILEAPKKQVNVNYATHFLNYKGIVSTEYLTNYIECESALAVIQDPVLGLNLMNFVLAPKSKTLTLDYIDSKDQYFCSFRVDVSLRAGEKGESIVFQYNKDFPLYFAPRDLESVKQTGISIEDSFPVIEGKYKLTILLQNPLDKEFSVVEREIEIPADTGSPRLSGPFVGYRFMDFQTGVHAPFKSLDKKLSIDPRNMLAASDDVAFFFNIANVTDDLWKEGEVAVSLKGMRDKDPSQKSFSVKLNIFPFRKILSVTQSIPAADLSPDYYELKLSLRDGRGKVLQEEKANFTLSLEKAIAHPTSNFKGFPIANSFLYFYMLAFQHTQLNQNEKAELLYQKALDGNPTFLQKVPEYANFLVRVRKFEKALVILEKIKHEEKLKFDYFLLRGRALLGREQYAEAIENLLEGNKIYNSDFGLLNALGFCYFKTGQKENALNALNASLRLNPNQPEIKKLVQEIGKNP